MSDAPSQTGSDPAGSPGSPGSAPAAAEPGPAPLFSLILCTAGTDRREVEIARLLDTLRAQTLRDFEVIVVDQNQDLDLVPRLIAPYQGDLAIRRVRSALGLSRARNAGLVHARGRLCGFPDDDCWYPADLLARVAAYFETHPDAAGLHGKGSDEQGRDMARFDDEAGPVTKMTAFERSVSCALFYRVEDVRAIGGFDEGLGLGSGTLWIGCEDYDFPIRLAEAGRAIHYDPALVVHHPCPSLSVDEGSVRRALTQSPSFGHLLVKHRYPPWFVAAKLIRPLGGAALQAARGRMLRARYHLAAFRGRAQGVLRTLRAPA